MGSLLKKVLTALAVKEVLERIIESRRKKPSAAARAGKAALFLGAAAGLYFAYSSGRLDPVIRKLTGSGEEGHLYRAAEPTPGTTAPGTTAPPPGTTAPPTA